MASFGVILVAAGKSSRFGDANYKKPFAPLAGRSVWLHAAEKFLDHDDVKQVVIVIAREDREYFMDKFGADIAFLGIKVAEGGEYRSDSVFSGFAALKKEIEFVAIHDAARPCLATRWIDNVFKTAVTTGAAILATPVVSTLKRIDEQQCIEGTIDRTNLWEAQTPQVFRRTLLADAFEKDTQRTATDEAQMAEAAGHTVTVVNGSPMNLKITSTEDIRLAEQILKVLPKPGLNNQAHPFSGSDIWR
jgi:2-C-methyl-D-erythritol 4-phosphate cytidylyltransferase